MEQVTGTAVVANGDRIRTLRRGRALSQIALARAAGCSLRTVQKAEKEAKVYLSTLKLLADALRVDHNEILRAEVFAITSNGVAAEEQVSDCGSDDPKLQPASEPLDNALLAELHLRRDLRRLSKAEQDRFLQVLAGVLQVVPGQRVVAN